MLFSGWLFFLYRFFIFFLVKFVVFIVTRYNWLKTLLGIFGIVFFAILLSKFIHLRQKNLFKRLTTLKKQLFKKGSNITSDELTLTWQKFLVINQNIIYLSSDIKQYTCYWTMPLTIFFFDFFAVQSYIFYILVFTPFSLFARMFFFAGLTNNVLFLYFLLYQFSRVAKCNVHLENANFKFFMCFFSQRGFQFNYTKRILKV